MKPKMKDWGPLEIDLSNYFTQEAVSVVPGPVGLAQEPSYLEANLPAKFFVVRQGTSHASSLDSQQSAVPSTSQEVVSLSQQVLFSSDIPKKRVLEPDLPEPGAIIDKYRIEELVGVGGFAAVYRATHMLLHTPVALKLLRPKVLKRRPELAPLLCDEARFAARIDHPNVVRVYDVTHTPNITYVVIEYVDGGSLADAISAVGHLSVPDVLKIGVEVTEGLAAGLKQGLIHRDIKPANILLTKTKQAKIADLGLAQMQNDPNSAVLASKGMVGTPGYMAPEQAVDSRTVDFRADIYALGVTLYHAAVGSPPFPVKDRERALELHKNAKVPLPSDKVSNFPRDVEKVLMQMLAKKPSERQSSYASLMGQLQQLLQKHPQ